MKELKAEIFTKDDNDIKALKGLITLFRGNYTRKIVDLVKDDKVY